jgi:beta-galactosidase/beta-glucuronidase
LWWARGFGEPNLYNFRIEVQLDEQIIAKLSTRTGIRTVRWL